MASGRNDPVRRRIVFDSNDLESSEKYLRNGSSDSNSNESSPRNLATILKSNNSANTTPTKIIFTTSYLESSGQDTDSVNDNETFVQRLVGTPRSSKDDIDEENTFGKKNQVLSSTPVKCRSTQPVVLSLFRDIHDLTRLDMITMENVLECLRERFRSHQFYTYAGPVLLSLNSCLRQPRASFIEDVTKMKWYFIDEARSASKENENQVNDNKKSPHVYDIGHKCIQNLVTIGSDQIILISGESGAGKTTATQQLIKYLTENNSRNFGANICSNLDKRIYFATLILESFGNAKTQANPNSSRFGRLVQLNYSKSTSQIVGAEIQTYLLEKHRVAKYDFLCERNFHIFYFILHGLKYGAIQADNVNWKDVSSLVQQDLLTDAAEVEEDDVHRLICAIQAFQMADFSGIVNVLLAMMCLLNASFVPDYDTSSEEEYYTGVESPSLYKVEYTVADKNPIRFASCLLGVRESELVDLLVAKKITAGSSHRHSIFRKPCENAKECEERLHALVSFVYDTLFSHILAHVNSSLKGGNGSVTGTAELTTLSLLDLYGFENFHVNHLEQICINYANERLQQMNVSIVKKYYEQSISQDEVMIPPTELIRIETELCQRIDELHTQVFGFFDEECLLRRSSQDKDILERMSMNLSSKKSRFIQTSRAHESKCRFTVAHYATNVEYQISGLVQKNKDHIPPEFQDILRSSTNVFVSRLFQQNLIRSRNISGANPQRSVHTISSNKNTRGKTILTRFKQSVEELMSRLKATEDKDVHFIRCIRPNLDLLAGTFCMDIVEKQLLACGIGDVVKIAGNGYPIRLSLTKFSMEFPKILKQFCSGQLDTKILSLIFSGSKKDSLKFGKTLVFMSEKCWKMFKSTENFLTLHNARIIQKVWRSNLKKKEILKKNLRFSRAHTSELVQSFEIFTRDGSLSKDTFGSSDDFISDEDINGNTDSCPINEDVPGSRQRHNFLARPPLYYGMGIASRAPIHTLPIKIYMKKTCLPFAEKPPRRLLANGITDAFEDYGIVFYQS